ncbi:MAG: aminotransferase class I/II-fold pyridoxal phosphate-dependent enzyme [Pseudomonadota bacterium]|nr:aminotransferase class I/II-fold pyridoxal phosphate-dependent enzyme [Pseudomonadota bacterium]
MSLLREPPLRPFRARPVPPFQVPAVAPALNEAFALFGATPALDRPLPVGQLYFPDWDRYEASMRDIFERQYYTNHGPLAQQLEARLAERLRVRHVICVTNATIGLIMACEALELTGKVILPSFTFIATPQALSWTRLTPVFCDVDPLTHQITADRIAPLIDAEVSAILAVNLWGDACPAAPLQALADRHGLKLFFDSAHSMGCEIGGVPVGNFGALEVFSFHATKAFSSAEGGCITTNDDALAAKLRNIRSSYGAGPAVSVVKTSNGRMSEAQAAIGLLNLDTFDTALGRNRASFARYRSRLAPVPGVTLYEPRHASKTNHQYVVLEIDEARFGLSRDALLGLLKAENIVARRYFYPGSHRSVPYLDELPQFVDSLPETDRLNARLIQLPSGALVSDADIDAIAERIATAQQRAADIVARSSEA